MTKVEMEYERCYSNVLLYLDRNGRRVAWRRVRSGRVRLGNITLMVQREKWSNYSPWHDSSTPRVNLIAVDTK
jgi:hypothetical protein